MPLPRFVASSVALTLATCLAACATPPPAPPQASSPAPPPPAARAPGCGPLFVSPAGEPFRRSEEGPPACPLDLWFAGADANRDGALSRTEFREDALRFFARLDGDGNGYVDGAELQLYEHRIAPEILGRGGGPRAALEAPARLVPVALQMGGGMGGRGGGHGGRGGRQGGSDGAGPRAGLDSGAGLARFGLLDEPEPVAAADLDFDGRITRAEFATRADQRFRSLDTEETGRLTLAALQQRLRDRARERSGGAPHGAGSPEGGHRRGGGGFGGGRPT